MNKPKPKTRYIPVSLEGLISKLAFETKRLIREKEEGIVKWISTKPVLNGNSVLVFKNKQGAMVTLSYRLDKDGALRFAHEKQYAHLPQDKNLRSAVAFGRSSKDI
jgi:hypothetical protein